MSVELELEIDEAELEERGDRRVLLLDKTIQSVVQESRVSLTLDGTSSEVGDDLSASRLLLFHCVAHPDPRARFRFVRVVLDFSPSKGVTVEDIAPREVQGAPTKITVKKTGTFKLGEDKAVLSDAVGRERTTEQTVYFPTLHGSIGGVTSATFDFLADGEAPLYADRDLYVLLRLPSEAIEEDGLVGRASVRAHLEVSGLARLIPVLGRKRVRIDSDFKADLGAQGL